MFLARLTRVAAAAPARLLSTYRTILSDKMDNGVAVVRLNRPPVNALNHELITELLACLKTHETDPAVGCIVLTGSAKAFAAGADIKEMVNRSFSEFRQSDPLTSGLPIGEVANCRKPIVAAVDGFVLGGGAELAMCCDVIIASDKAVFGQPEIKLGIIPGAGGTQRLAAVVGKSKAMQMCLTGESIDAHTAERAGLVSEVHPSGLHETRAIAVAASIAAKSQVVVSICRDAVLTSMEVGLTEGLKAEKAAFFSCFATKDQKEGMTAFVEKRKPVFKHE